MSSAFVCACPQVRDEIAAAVGGGLATAEGASGEAAGSRLPVTAGARVEAVQPWALVLLALRFAAAPQLHLWLLDRICPPQEAGGC